MRRCLKSLWAAAAEAPGISIPARNLEIFAENDIEIYSPSAELGARNSVIRDIAYHDRKEADESGECDARLAADPEPHDKQGSERNFQNQLEYDEVGVVTKRIHQQK